PGVLTNTCDLSTVLLCGLPARAPEGANIGVTHDRLWPLREGVGVVHLSHGRRRFLSGLERACDQAALIEPLVVHPEGCRCLPGGLAPVGPDLIDGRRARSHDE